jgi:hypothetical protein
MMDTHARGMKRSIRLTGPTTAEAVERWRRERDRARRRREVAGFVRSVAGLLALAAVAWFSLAVLG